MTVETDVQQMADDLRHRSEKLDVEFKAWMDISKKNKDGQTKIARHIAAIANHGGGRLYFGVDDDGNPQPASDEFGLDHYRSDALHNLLKTRLDPPIQCEVRFTEYTNGVTYPVIYIPSHGITPVSARDENSYMQVYVRSVGPESIRVSTYQQWDTLLKRCMRFRELEAIQNTEENDLARTQTMTKAITESVTSAVLKAIASQASIGAVKPAGPDWETIAKLSEATRHEFLQQIAALQFGDTAVDQQIREISDRHVTAGYALLDDHDNFLTLERPHALLRVSSEGMDKLASFGWHDFLVGTNSDVSPRTRYWSIDGKDVSGVEGMRIESRSVYFGSFDYWRAYGNSVFVICKSFREDYNRLRHNVDDHFLTTTQVFIRSHSLLAHAFLSASQVPEAEKIAIFVDHRGLKNRVLGRDFDYGLRVHTHLKALEDKFVVRTVVSREELLTDYFGTLKRVVVAFLELWEGSSFDPSEWFSEQTVDNLIDYLTKEGSSVRLPMAATNPEASGEESEIRGECPQ